MENRTWSTTHRGPVAIHAARLIDQSGYAFLARLGIDPPTELVTGAVIGLVRLVDCRRDEPSLWAFPDRWHWIFQNPTPLDRPMPLRGQTRLFRLPQDMATELLATIETRPA